LASLQTATVDREEVVLESQGEKARCAKLSALRQFRDEIVAAPLKPGQHRVHDLHDSNSATRLSRPH
jgi:hypothetical protein